MKRKENGTTALLSFSLELLTYIHAYRAPRSPDQDWNRFILNPLYTLNLTQTDSPFFLLSENIHLYFLLRVRSTQIVTE